VVGEFGFEGDDDVAVGTECGGVEAAVGDVVVAFGGDGRGVGGGDDRLREVAAVGFNGATWRLDSLRSPLPSPWAMPSR
jgi:hypothetical protein